MHQRLLITLPAVAALALLSCATEQPPAANASATSHATAALTATDSGVTLHQPRAGLYTAGQPVASDWSGLKAAGITTVINLRPVSELQGRDEAAEVNATGMRYIEIPVADGSAITRENARKLHMAMSSAKGSPVLLHCASANRAGGLLALVLVTEQGMPPEQALEVGRNAGMKSTEARVREVLQLPPKQP